MRDQAVHEIVQRPWRSDSLSDQLDDLAVAAERLGLEKAAEWLRDARKPRTRPQSIARSIKKQ
jgi:hypothetical protein